MGRIQPHSAGLLGEVAFGRETKAVRNYHTFPRRDTILEGLTCRTVAAVSLKPAGDVEAVLFVADETAAASWARLILIDELGNVVRQMMAGTGVPKELGAEVRPQGLSRRAMKPGKPVVIEDSVNPKYEASPFILENRIEAALCLPLLLRGKPIGVMWINYDHPRRFRGTWRKWRRRGRESWQRPGGSSAVSGSAPA